MRTLPEKINHQFRTLHPPSRGECKGYHGNPTKKHLEAVARFFGIPAGHLLDAADTAEVVWRLEGLSEPPSATPTSTSPPVDSRTLQPRRRRSGSPTA